MTMRIVTAFIPADLPIASEYIAMSLEAAHSFYGVIVTCVYRPPAAAEYGDYTVLYEVSAARLWEHINTYNLAYKESRL